MTELKPCPFCGSRPITDFRITSFGSNRDEVRFSIICQECRTEKAVRIKDNGKPWQFDDLLEAMDGAAELWNTRKEENAYPEPPIALLEATFQDGYSKGFQEGLNSR